MTEISELSKAGNISVAPMMDWTDRHCRYFLRLIHPQMVLYTEMVTAAAIVHGDQDRLLAFDAAEHPVALQLGGSNVQWMSQATSIAAGYGYDEININVGCPSDRVQNGQFGACLMATPERVATCFKAMQEATDAPVTIKSRIGIDDNDEYEYLQRFVEPQIKAGCRTFIVHARVAILEGLSPKDNREVPPLKYEYVYRLKRDFPELTVVLNGGINSVEAVDTALQQVDGVMIGRKAYQDPYFLAQLGEHLDSDYTAPSRHEVVERMLPYIEQQLEAGERLGRMTRHMLGLFAGQPGGRGWRRYLSENAYAEDADVRVVQRALDTMAMAA
ncbi:MAG: tRNA dihydrouridine(20/20a) synthase DusA [Pseudomonadota bacterium]